ISILSWRYQDPAALVATRVGASPRRTIRSAAGGNYPQTLVNQAALDIQSGVADVVLVGGAEAWRTRSSIRATGDKPEWTIEPEGTEPTQLCGSDESMWHPAETARQLLMPIQYYPLFDNALRAADGITIDDQRDRISALWSRFSTVAATNPHAWIRTEYPAETIRTATADNRMVGFPYTKLMNSNNAVEQSAAVVVCSVEKARSLGIPTDRWVFPWAGSDAHDHEFVSNRADLASSPAIRLAGRACLDLAGVGLDDLAHVDVYSCFPSAVQVAARELGLALDRPLTVTGGLSFAGGPWNNYVTHAIATMVEQLRAEPGAIGLCTANGGFLTKHAFGVYSTLPPANPFRHGNPQAEVDALPSREACESFDGVVTVEASTVMHDRQGEPETAFVSTLLDGGQRAWGTSHDADVMKACLTDEVAGRTAHLSADGDLTFI
ncbi:MAG TPA: acetyl-CoA acetyltransferase, partial [Acidimicrobiales bacterium]